MKTAICFVLAAFLCVSSAYAADEFCNRKGSSVKMSYGEAQKIALAGECGQKGTLKSEHFCSEITGTWWIDLNPSDGKCNPACVINVETKESEINWRCTGLLRPEQGVKN